MSDWWRGTPHLTGASLKQKNLDWVNRKKRTLTILSWVSRSLLSASLSLPVMVSLLTAKFLVNNCSTDSGMDGSDWFSPLSRFSSFPWPAPSSSLPSKAGSWTCLHVSRSSDRLPQGTLVWGPCTKTRRGLVKWRKCGRDQGGSTQRWEWNPSRESPIFERNQRRSQEDTTQTLRKVFGVSSPVLQAASELCTHSWLCDWRPRWSSDSTAICASILSCLWQGDESCSKRAVRSWCIDRISLSSLPGAWRWSEREGRVGKGKGGIDHLVMLRYLRVYMSINKQCHNLWRVKKGSDCGIVALMKPQMIGHVDCCCSSIRNIYTDTEERLRDQSLKERWKTNMKKEIPSFGQQRRGWRLVCLID